MSTRERLIAFFIAPARFCADICDSPYIEINWRIPVTVFVAVTLILRQIMLTNPALVGQMQAKITDEINAAVTTSQMSQEEADQARTFATPGSTPPRCPASPPTWPPRRPARRPPAPGWRPCSNSGRLVSTVRTRRSEGAGIGHHPHVFRVWICGW